MRSDYDTVLRCLTDEFVGWQVLLDYEYPLSSAKPIDLMLLRRGLHDFAFQSSRLTGLLQECHLVIKAFSVHYSTTQNVTYVDIQLLPMGVPRVLCPN